jgi:hypothetical protein
MATMPLPLYSVDWHDFSVSQDDHAGAKFNDYTILNDKDYRGDFKDDGIIVIHGGRSVNLYSSYGYGSICKIGKFTAMKLGTGRGTAARIERLVILNESFDNISETYISKWVSEENIAEYKIDIQQKDGGLEINLKSSLLNNISIVISNQSLHGR